MVGGRVARDAPTERERLVENLFARLHPVMAWLAALFVLVLVGDAIVADDSPFARIFTIAGWVIWGVFVIEFSLRLAMAPSKSDFFRRNWWQAIFLLLPFLALFRFLMALRVARAGRLLSAAVRGTRSAAAELGTRVSTVIAVTVMVILLSANLLFEFAGIQPYAKALHAAAMGTIAGAPIPVGNGLADVVEVFLALYSVAVVAAVAGSLGAYFLERKREETQEGPHGAAVSSQRV